MRTFLGNAVQNGWKFLQLDVQTSFVNGHLKEELYVQKLYGYVRKGKESQVVRIHKALYGLKQAARQLNDYLCKILEALSPRVAIATSHISTVTGEPSIY